MTTILLRPEFQDASPKSPLKVGDKLWRVLANHRHIDGPGVEVEVTKVGRKWATIGQGYQPYRIDLETWSIDGGDHSSPGRCYASQETYRESIRLQDAWRKLMSFMSSTYGNVPPGIDLAWIEAVHEKLGIPK